MCRRSASSWLDCWTERDVMLLERPIALVRQVYFAAIANDRGACQLFCNSAFRGSTVRFPPFASTKCTTLPAPKCAPTRTTTPPSGVSFRIESRRTRFNCGVVQFRQHTESALFFESVSLSMKGEWKETRGVQRPILGETPVSESRMAWLNPFQTKRKKAPSGTSSRVRDVQVAEGMGLESNALHLLSH